VTDRPTRQRPTMPSAIILLYEALSSGCKNLPCILVRCLARFAVDVILGRYPPRSPSPAPSCASRHFPTRCRRAEGAALIACPATSAWPHDGFDPLKCWRKSAADLAYHAILPILARPRSSLKSGRGSRGARGKPRALAKPRHTRRAARRASPPCGAAPGDRGYGSNGHRRRGCRIRRPCACRAPVATDLPASAG
jgi:hypothetical protein